MDNVRSERQDRVSRLIAVSNLVFYAQSTIAVTSGRKLIAEKARQLCL